MIHEIGISCPKCRTSDIHANMLNDGKSQTRSPHCINCNGDGFLYRNSAILRGLVTGIRQQKNIYDIGLAQPGDLQFSIESSELDLQCNSTIRRISQGDKFTATWSQSLENGQTLIRGAATLGENKRLSNNVNDSEDRLWYEPSNSLWCEDENGITYDENTDFLLGPGKVIKWVGNSPTIKTKYTLKYTAFFEWLVFMSPQERIDRDNRNLGPLVMLRKRHVAFINDSPFITEKDRVPLSKRMEC